MRRMTRRRPPIDLVHADGGPDDRGLMIWIAALGWPLSDALSGSGGHRWAGLALIAAVAVLYAATLRTVFDARYPMRLPLALLAAQTAATAAALGWLGRPWLAAVGVLGVAAGAVAGHLPRPGGGIEWAMLLVIGGATVPVTAAARLGGLAWDAAISALWVTGTAALVTAIVIRLFLLIGMLRDAREELAEAAVERERLRFSRDLHDLLGHTLSLMVVKAQAVRLVAGRDPAVAAQQAADIETVGREALGEVRQAVAGYRGRGLAAEFEAARAALADAGVEPVVRRTGPPLPDAADALLGWAVREGVTNVIRHSGARTCTLTLRNGGGSAVLEVADDGRGGAPRGGHGLRGLRERVGEAGGEVAAGPRPDGGFLLTVTVGTEEFPA
ncbi:sensor histidine kinase [Actinomadura atramentaria]|uniref:sensor histidine kinase n=1 Tax=Actinomadura atramentaria TaxID=1990 RepID=UPI000373CFEB|nr:sensor histidine kinase [Actinomadura atramentaria]